MDHPTLGRILLIANPQAGDGRGKVLTRLVAALAASDLDADVAETSSVGHATSIARTEAESGRRLVVAVGGDGTVNEVVTGLVDADTGVVRGDDPVLAVVSAGSGCDLVRTFGLDRDPETLARHLATPAMTRIDLGRVRAVGSDGAPTARLFANVAEVGFGGTVAATARRLPARLGAQRYRLGIVAAWGAFRRVHMVVQHDGGEFVGRLCNVVVANGQFFGGGLKVSPRALPDDGLLHLQTWGGSPTDVVRAARQLRDGSHLRRADVRSWSTASVSVVAERPVAVEVDGEPSGSTPASFDTLHRVLAFKL